MQKEAEIKEVVLNVGQVLGMSDCIHSLMKKNIIVSQETPIVITTHGDELSLSVLIDKEIEVL